jgi:hypothetical protein
MQSVALLKRDLHEVCYSRRSSSYSQLYSTVELRHADCRRVRLNHAAAVQLEQVHLKHAQGC